MQTFIALRNKGSREEQEEVAERALSRLTAYYAEFFTTEPETYRTCTPQGTLLFADIKAETCLWPFVQEDDRTIVYSCSYPRHWQGVLGSDEQPHPEICVLPELCRRIQENPREVVSKLAAPFQLSWVDKPSGDIWLVNDAIGLGQTFQLRTADCSAWGNNLVLLAEVTGTPLVPKAEDWQMKVLTRGYFLGDRTGYEHVSALPASTLVRIGRDGVKVRELNAVRDWFQPIEDTNENLVELCNERLQSSIRDAHSYWPKTRMALSGGWDSRAMVAAAIAAGIDPPVFTSGHRTSTDVSVARKLVRLANLSWERRPPARPMSAADLRDGLVLRSRMMAGDGYHWGIANNKRRSGVPGSMTVGGQGGEMLRGYFYNKATAKDGTLLSREEMMERFVRANLGRGPIRDPKIIDIASEEIRNVLLQAFDAGLDELGATEYYYLMMKMRRWGARTSWGQHTIVNPIFDPLLLRPATSLEPRAKRGNALVKELIRRNCPAWADMPTAKTRRFRKLPFRLHEHLNWLADGIDSIFWKRPTSGASYCDDGYLPVVAGPLIDDALESPRGLVADVVDTQQVLENWQRFRRRLRLRRWTTVSSNMLWEVMMLNTVDQVYSRQDRDNVLSEAQN